MGDLEEVREFYAGEAQKKSLGFGSKLSQEVRFESLIRVMGDPPESLLDVGCGSGDLLEYACRQGRPPKQYLGVDVVPEMIAWAKERCFSPMVKLLDWRVGSLDVVGPQELFQWVTGMAIFDIAVSREFLFQTVKKMFDHCTEAVAFTALWKDPSKKKTDGRVEVLFEPFELVKDLRVNLTERVLLDFSYAPHTYSVYVWKSLSPWMQEWRKTGGWE